MTSKLIQPTLPTAGEVTAMLLVADQNHERLQSEWFAAWERVQVADLNADVALKQARRDAWKVIKGSNKDERDALIEAELVDNRQLKTSQAIEREAHSTLKLCDIALESARVHRGALHDIAKLVMAERLAEANRGLGALYSWGQD